MRGGLPVQGQYLSPIVLFVYNRLEHTRQTIEALAANKLANESELFIFSDAPKDESAVEKVQAVRSYLKKIKGFKSIHIVERETNWGLAKSIVEGVTEIINQYRKIIVLEDDIVTSPYFLKFMNGALDFYKSEKRVWHISGWNYPIKTNGLDDAFFWRTMSCWGWATWYDRWQFFEKKPDKIFATFTKKDIYHFTIDGAEKDMWEQILANKAGMIDTWAIFWYATIFQNSGLCFNATRSFVRNIGFDGSGVHCGRDSIYFNNILCEKDIKFNILAIQENQSAVKRIKTFCKKYVGLRYRIFRYFQKMIRWFKLERA